MFRFPMLCCALFLSLAVALAQEDARLPIPAKDAAAAAEKSIKEIYRTSYVKTKAADRSVLATTLFDNAAQSKDEPATQYVFLREARDVAAKAGDFPLYLAAAKKLAGAFRISETDAVAGSIDALAVGMASGASTENGHALVELVDDAIRGGDFASAQKILKGADAISRKSVIPSLTAAVTLRSKSLPALRKDFDKLPEANKTLETDPADKKANLMLGRFLCFVKNDWDAGLARLVLGSEGPLRVAVDKDVAAGSGGVPERIDAGDQWKKLAGAADPLQKKNLESRALFWYLQAVDDATGLNKVRVEKHIQELASADNKWVLLSHQMNDPKSWKTTGTWTLDGKTATGEEQASRELLLKLPNDCVIEFDLVIDRGDRTRIFLHHGGPEIWLGCEGDGNTLTFYVDGAIDKGGPEYRYKRGEVTKVKLEFKKDKMQAFLGDAPPITARRASQGVGILLSVGDGFSQGKSSYSHFRISADGR